ncbi:hypothetical protein [Angustibacter sp. Root456]|uniref:hypothetical protein n=1 Tax=Angustibacter sp. Root456 TaxID=1736539 RepID=UPI0006F9D4C4|nr:hypothetical protein [Angustibacter sp. Root456]KQX69772.1 hypothetical protein ASD06_01725 [Angustibacter sp. Root456]
MTRTDATATRLRPSRPDVTGRLLPLSGAAYTALLVVAAAAFPAPPGGDVSPAADPSWLAEHTGDAIAQSYVRALAAVAFLALTAAVVTAIRRALPRESSLGPVAVVGGALTGGLVLAAQGTALAAALYVDAGGDAAVTQALGSLQSGLLDVSALPAVLLFGAAGIAGLRSAFVPRWLTWLSLAGVPFALVDAGSYDGGPLEVVGLLGLAYFLAWSLLMGVRLAMDPRAASTD